MKWIENGYSSVEFLCSQQKKNIFLIGDSIRCGYCATTKEELEDIANVFYVDENCRSTQYVISSLKGWSEKFSHPELVDIVQFNCGHWDAAHWSGYKLPLTSEHEYQKNIEAIIYLLRYFFPNAKLVFATTTPMNPEGGSIGGVNPRSNEDILRYNEIAIKVALAHNVMINDLNAYMRDWGSEYYIDTCHLTTAAFETLGQKVANQLRLIL